MAGNRAGTEVQENFSAGYTKKMTNGIKANRAVKLLAFDKSEAHPGETFIVHVPKLGQDEVLVPGSLGLQFDIDLTCGHANNYLVQNVSRALVSKMIVKFAGRELQNTRAYDIFKIYEDLFVSQEERDNMILEGIQSEKLNKIRCNAGDKPTSGVASETKLNEILGTKYYIWLDHQILTDHGVFYRQALFNDLSFEITLADANTVVKGSDASKLKYKLTKINLEYEIITNKMLAEEVEGHYSSGKEFLYDQVQLQETITFAKGSTSRLNVKVCLPKRSMKAILLLFTEPYNAGTRDSEKYVFPDIKNVRVSINGSPDMLYNHGIDGTHFWREAKRFFVRKENKTEHMNMKLFLTGDRFGLLVDLRSMPDRSIHGSGKRVVGSTDGVQLLIERKASGSENLNCQVFVISDAQLSILGQRLEDLQY